MPTKCKDNGVQVPFTDPEFLAKWQEWLTYRSERKIAKYVPTGLKATFTRLVKDSGNDPKVAIQMIDQSIEMSWQGIFPLKKKYNGQINTGNIGNKPVHQPIPQGGFGQL